MAFCENHGRCRNRHGCVTPADSTGDSPGSRGVVRIAIAGNPNCGKTCLFNALTGSMQRVGNYPGVTVEFVSGESEFAGRKLEIVDLPGTYSLTAYSQEEVVARDYIVREKPDVILNVVDAATLERNLYLTVQLMELRIPMVLVLNMVDVAERKGVAIDERKLSDLLGMPVVKTVANRNRGMKDLLNACVDAAEKAVPPKTMTYTHELRDTIAQLDTALKAVPHLCHDFPTRWVAAKLLEDDEETLRWFEDAPDGKHVAEALAAGKRRLAAHSAEESSLAVAEARYAFANGAVREVTQMSEEARQMLTERIDRVVCNRLLGPVILCAVVYLLFTIVFRCADEWEWVPLLDGTWASPTRLFELFFQYMAEWTAAHVETPWLQSLLVDGIIGGVGGVMGFVPLIFFMFLFISFLEDSGYVARVAFILDKLLYLFGLQGKSILALIVSGGLGAGGCAVPGVMAARTLREEKDRLITILVAPFMNCGAKLPVYAMLIAAFFEGSRGAVLFLLWLLSWIFALGSALCLRRWVIKGAQTPFVMELPIYHMPTLNGVLMDTWHRTFLYIKKAATVILAMSVVLWALMYFPRLPEETTSRLDETEISQAQLRHSFAGRTGETLVPLSQLAGFDWRDNIALIGGFAAKEVVLGTLATAYSMGADSSENGSDSLSSRLAADPDWNRLRAFALMVFVMAYAPCLATVAAIRKETNSWGWAVFSTLYSTTAAFIVAVLIFQIGNLFTITTV